MRFQFVVALPSPPDVVVGYALNRSQTRGEFSDRDVAVMNALSVGTSPCTIDQRLTAIALAP